MLTNENMAIYMYVIVIPWFSVIISDNCPDSRGRSRGRGQLSFGNPDVAMVELFYTIVTRARKRAG